MENRMARQVCFVAAILGVPSLSMAQELASAAVIGTPASILPARESTWTSWLTSWRPSPSIPTRC